MKNTLQIFICLTLLSFQHIYAQKKPEFLRNYDVKWVESTFNSLSLDEKIGQLLMPRGNVSGKGYDPQKLKNWVRDYKLGGIVFFAGQPSTQAKIVNELQAMSKVPMLIGMDLEWGLAMRLDSTVRFPYQLSLGQMQGGEDLIYQMGQEVGLQCKRMGVHVNYAPVVDINSNPKNPVINFRSFGGDKYAVANKALAYMQGMQSQNILTSAKHFPGHGDTGVDSHHDLPVIPYNLEYLKKNEFFPYKYLIDNGLTGVMTSHLSLPEIEKTPNLAATFSPIILQNILRNDMKFEGLTFTDAMDMQGAVKYFPNGEALVKAILAGNDILETFEDVPTAVKAIKEAINSKKLPMSILDARVKKVLMAKSWVGLNTYKPIVLDRLIEDLNAAESDLINRKMAEKLLCLVKNEKNEFPLKDIAKKIQIISIDAESESFFQKMAAKYTTIENINIGPKESVESTENKLKMLDKEANVILAMHHQNIRPVANYGLNAGNLALLNRVLEKYNPHLVLFGNSYSLDKIEKIQSAKSILLAGQPGKYTEEAATMAIFGGIETTGRLPVSVNASFKMGDGYSSEAIGRLKYGTPEMEGISSKVLESRVDSVINAGLDAKAYPGAVMQITKNGRVIFEKQYGFMTFEDAAGHKKRLRAKPNAEKTNLQDAMDYFEKPSPIANNKMSPEIDKTEKGEMTLNAIFDMASVTKISTSALAIMQLQSEGKFDLNKTLGDYLPESKGTNKENLKFIDMLTHRSGLKAWIPFWMDCVDTTATIEKALAARLISENDFIKVNHKQGFFAKMFKKTPAFHYDYTASIVKNKDIWTKALKDNTITWKPDIFSTRASDTYNVEVVKDLYMNKAYLPFVRKQILDSPVNPAQGYVYSDLHYYLYPSIIKSITGQNWEEYLAQTYNSLGAKTLGYNPRKKYNLDQIVPTEADPLFRKTLIHGYVHDEGASMNNGVSGHAGLFGTANDLSKLVQMYLQKGYFGGVQYIKPEVLSANTAYQFPYEGNRRAIAFDKLDFDKKINNGPQAASTLSYGHSGYTGTFTWVDPKYNLTYVFLSNRVYPTRDNVKISTMNIRTALGDQIIKTIEKK
jgi:beta-N-acetylhexosaminidase